MRVGLCTLALSKLSLEDVLRKAKEVGFDGIELWGKEPHSPVFHDADRVKAIRAQAEEAGVTIAVFGSYEYWLGGRLEPEGYEMALKKALSAVEITAGLGCRMMRVWSGYRPAEEASEEDWRLTVEGLKATAEAALKKDITLVMEVHDNMMTDRIAGIRRLLADVDMPNLKVNFQVQYKAGCPEPAEVIAAVGTHIRHVHAGNIEAKVAPGGALKIPPIDGGLYDWREIIRALKGVGYDAYLNVEHAHSEEDMAEQYRSLRRLIAECGA